MSGALQRVEELLATRATEGLEEPGARELEELLRRRPSVDPESFDRAAAAVELALAGEPEELPASLKLRIVRGYHEHREHLATAAPTIEPAVVRSFRPRQTASGRGGWLAAAACLALAIAGWWPRTQVEPPASSDAPPAAESVALVAGSADALTAPWKGTEDPWSGDATGEVVWSSASQEGYMRIRGLVANDPAVAQYQLWIFDRSGDERYPVDGGVFDIPAGSPEVVVPIDAKIAVDEPYLFAVTVERPGGVVVSSRERIVLLAEA